MGMANADGCSIQEWKALSKPMSTPLKLTGVYSPDQDLTVYCIFH